MKFSIEVEPTIEQLADHFWNLDATQQANFFQELYYAATRDKGVGQGGQALMRQMLMVGEQIRSMCLLEAEQAISTVVEGMESNPNPWVDAHWKEKRPKMKQGE